MELMKRSRRPSNRLKTHVNKGTEESDGAGEQTVLEQSSIKPPRKRRVKKNTDESDVADEEEALLLDQRGNRKLPKKRRLTKCTDDAQKNPKRPWSEEEKSAVERRMGTFIAVRRVPGKDACMMCITLESPALKDRTCITQESPALKDRTCITQESPALKDRTCITQESPALQDRTWTDV